MENLIIQDVKQGIGVGLLDPKGELTDNVIARLPDREKEQKVILLDITEKDFFPGLNLFACADPTSDREIQYTLNQVIHVFEKAFGITSLNPRLYDYLYNCAYTLIANPGYTMMDIRLLLTNPTFRSTLLGNVTDPVVLDFWQKYYNPLPERQQREEAREILRRLNDLSHDPLRYIIGQAQSTINLQQIMDEGKILLVKLNSKRFEQATRLIGSIIVALILNASDVRQTKKQFNLYADEFQRFATEDFATLIEEARYAGIGIAMAHQNRGQLELTEKQADTNLKQRTLSVGNLVVFRAPTDADGLAGQFTQEPDAAWVQVNRPQEHERIEEQVEVEVEDDIEEIAQNPVDYLIGGRGTHGSPRVREAIHVIPHILTKQEQSRRLGNYSEDVKNPLNALLVDAMEKRVKIKSDDFCLRVEEIVREGFGWRKSITPDQRRIIFEQRQSEFIRGLLYYQDDPAIWEQQRTEVIEVYIAWYLYEKGEDYRYYKPEDYFHAPKYYKGQHLGGYPEKTDEEVKNFMNSLEREIRSQRHWQFNEWMKTLDEITTFVTNFTILCEELAADPIKVPTGKQRMVKRIQPHLTYLTHESEKITHPRIAIMHPQRSYADVLNEVASQLANLPAFSARAKFATEGKPIEFTIKTLEPERGLGRAALQERIERIQARNTDDGYTRLRQEVEEEIRTRQNQWREPPETPITRRNQ